MAGKLGLPRHLARSLLLSGASNCTEPNTDARRLPCDVTHMDLVQGFVYGRLSRGLHGVSHGRTNRREAPHAAVRGLASRPVFTPESSRRDA